MTGSLSLYKTIGHTRECPGNRLLKLLSDDLRQNLPWCSTSVDCGSQDLAILEQVALGGSWLLSSPTGPSSSPDDPY